MSRAARSWLVLVVLALSGALATPSAGAHALRLAHLELRYDGGSALGLSWRSQEGEPAPTVILGSPCRVVGEAASGSVAQQLDCPGAARAWRLQLADLPPDLPIVLALRRGDEAPRVRWLADAGARAWPWFGAAGAWAEAADYLRAGAEHVLAGADHLLFLVALFVICRGTRQLAQGTLLFTLGHALSLLAIESGRVTLSPRLAELGIALTLVVAARAIALQGAEAAGEAKSPHSSYTMAATFGVVHGLGFAGALEQVGLQATDALRAVAAFNVGVELGQLAFVAALAAGARGLRRLPVWHAWPWARLASLLVGSAGVSWCLGRVVSA